MSDGAREARYAEAMHRDWNEIAEAVLSPGDDDTPVSSLRLHASHTMAVADAEVAAAVSEAQAEIARLREGIRALADYWDGLAPGDQHYANRIRALLAPSPAATTGDGGAS